MMIREVPKPKISAEFSIEDIHKIREWNYERMKDATPEERLNDWKRRSEPTRRAIEAMKNSSAASNEYV